jgi:hypothetical protein
MSSKTKGQAAIARTEEPPTTIRFDIRKDDKVKVTGYAGLGVEDDITIIIKGSVLNLGTNEWDQDRKHVTVTPKSIEFSKVEKPVSMGSALADADKTRKKVN